MHKGLRAKIGLTITQQEKGLGTLTSDKRTITVDANDIAGGFGIFEKILDDATEVKFKFSNLSGLFDSVFSWRNGLRIVVKNAENLSSDARKMLDDALANSTGLEVVLEYGNGRAERRTSADPVNVHITFTGNGSVAEDKKKDWWRSFRSCLVNVILVMVAIDLVILAVFLLYRYFSSGR